MNIHSITFKIEHYLITGTNKRLTETDIIKYYTNLGYDVTKKYYNRLRKQIANNSANPVFKTGKLSTKILDVFRKYKSGYPDIILVKDKKVSFIEIKLDNDSLRASQIEFLEELTKVADVKVCYFNNMEGLRKEDRYKSKTPLKKDKQTVLDQLELYSRLARAKGNKPLWAVARLYNKFGKLILDKDVLGLIANRVNQPKEKIIWFVNEHMKDHPTRVKDDSQ